MLDRQMIKKTKKEREYNYYRILESIQSINKQLQEHLKFHTDKKEYIYKYSNRGGRKRRVVTD